MIFAVYSRCVPLFTRHEQFISRYNCFFMLNYYQPSIWPFLHTKRYQLSSDIRQQYFFSFEDGLWELLHWLKIKSGAKVLVPDFYCMDVVKNIEQHGYRVIFYPLDEHFQIKLHRFSELILEHEPAVVVVFHACGIKNILLGDGSLFHIVPPSTVVIEDSVQSLIDPTQMVIRRKNHIVMDSLRKVSPLPGSMMYTNAATFSQDGEDWQPVSYVTEWWYVASASIWYAIFRMVLWIGMVSRFPWLVKIAHEIILKKHDDIIGDSTRGYRGFPIWAYLHRYINFSKIAACKAKQVSVYQSKLDKLLEVPELQKYFYRITYNSTDTGSLHVFPVGLRMPLSQSALHWLHASGAVVWQKFPDAPWSTDKGVLFLPLGFHVSEADIQHVCLLLAKLPQQW